MFHNIFLNYDTSGGLWIPEFCEKAAARFECTTELEAMGTLPRNLCDMHHDHGLARGTLRLLVFFSSLLQLLKQHNLPS